MKEFRVRESEAGQSVWKYITKLMPGASASLLRKSLRKKNITLNDRKLEGKEKIQAGDSIKIWFSDETIDKFMGKKKRSRKGKLTGMNSPEESSMKIMMCFLSTSRQGF